MNKILGFKILLISLVIATYSFLSVFSISSTSHMSHHMNNSSNDCPYVVGEKGLCPMNMFDHIASWQQFSQAAFPMFEILLMIVLLFSVFYIWFYYSPPPKLFYKTQYNLPPNLYQSLFSKGILNSKEY